MHPTALRFPFSSRHTTALLPRYSRPRCSDSAPSFHSHTFLLLLPELRRPGPASFSIPHIDSYLFLFSTCQACSSDVRTLQHRETNKRPPSHTSISPSSPKAKLCEHNPLDNEHTIAQGPHRGAQPTHKTTMFSTSPPSSILFTNLPTSHNNHKTSTNYSPPRLAASTMYPDKDIFSIPTTRWWSFRYFYWMTYQKRSRHVSTPSPSFTFSLTYFCHSVALFLLGFRLHFLLAAL